ncbi:MAG: kinase/pyrophosphorylase [Planctomycetes bacterium]|nr:kinase/pyrophosphorylase [Planctomycetota bacterium]
MSPAKKKTRRRIVLLSGSTGRTVKEVVDAALAQFKDPDVEIILKSHVRSVKAAIQAVEEAAETKAILFHSIVAPKVREAVVRQAHARRVPSVDVLGQVLSALNDYLGEAPRLKPGLSYQLHKEQFDRIEAVNYTLAHDDGCAPEGLPRADVVLVGPSRVAKSATCFYLAYRGVRAANVPLVSGWQLPRQLLELDERKVIGLTMNPTRLQSIRRERVRDMGRGPFEHYSDLDTIRHELRDAARLVARHGWRSIDISYKSVEEVARDVLKMIGR